MQNIVKPKRKEKKLTTGIYLSEQLHNQIKNIAEKSEVSFNECAVQLLTMAVNSIDSE